MMLTYLKGVGAKALEKPVTDCVISVSERERKRKRFNGFLFRCHLFLLTVRGGQY